jgi:hypothetical protein
VKRYWLQARAPAGNWVDMLGTDDRELCIGHGKWMVLHKHAQAVRVVEREDKPIPIWGPYEAKTIQPKRP